jgi:hypothetical protein
LCSFSYQRKRTDFIMSTHLKISEVSKMLGGDNQTIRAWVDSGKLKCFRTSNGHHRFNKAYMERVLSGGAEMQNINNEKNYSFMHGFPLENKLMPEI